MATKKKAEPVYMCDGKECDKATYDLFEMEERLEWAEEKLENAEEREEALQDRLEKAIKIHAGLIDTSDKQNESITALELRVRSHLESVARTVGALRTQSAFLVSTLGVVDYYREQIQGQLQQEVEMLNENPHAFSLCTFHRKES